MHGTAQAVGHAAFAAEDLGKGTYIRYSTRDTGAVPPIGIGQVVIGVDTLDNADTHCFLPLAQMRGAVNETVEITELYAFFEFPDFQHPRIESQEIVIRLTEFFYQFPAANNWSAQFRYLQPGIYL